MKKTEKIVPRPRPLILVSNDDGYDSPGIYALVMALRDLGDVFVSAPATQQSAVGHAITMQMPLRAREISRGKIFRGWAVEGTPADSVKLGATTLLHRRPDLIVSGINHGMNTSINVIYSGTVSAATEGAILGIPSIAVSLATHALNADLRGASKYARRIASIVLKRGLPPGTLLNVNVPNIPIEQLRGMAVTRQGRSWWDDGFEARSDPNGKTYYWLFGKYVWDTDERTDDAALQKGFVSITPLHYSLTDENLFDQMQTWKLERTTPLVAASRIPREKKG